MSAEAELRAAVCAEALQWLRTPWRHRGRVLGAGVDCAHLLLEVYTRVGLLQPGAVDPGVYPMDWHLHRSTERFLAGVLSVAVPTQSPKPGDAALFKFGRVISHGAIVLDPAHLIVHAYAPEGAVVISDLSASAHLSDRLVGYYTLITP